MEEQADHPGRRNEKEIPPYGYKSYMERSSSSFKRFYPKNVGLWIWSHIQSGGHKICSDQIPEAIAPARNSRKKNISEQKGYG